jgi:hypothetical protein
MLIVALALAGACDKPAAGDAAAAPAPAAATPVAAVAAKPRPMPPPSKLEGRWCEPDPNVGCYRFEGSTVIEEALANSTASKGTFQLDDDMLVMRFKEGPWSLQVVKIGATVMILKDLSRNYTYTFTRS